MKKIKKCVRYFFDEDDTEDIPKLALQNAKVTAASIIADPNNDTLKQYASQLVEGVKSNAAAQVLLTIGEADAAKNVAADDGIFSMMLD